MSSVKFRAAGGDYWLELDGTPVVWYDTHEEWTEAARRVKKGDVVLQQNHDGTWSPAEPLPYYHAPLWRKILGKAVVVLLIAVVTVFLLVVPPILFAFLKGHI